MYKRQVLALANKESLVVGGDLIMPMAAEPGRLMPIDSEHGAIYPVSYTHLSYGSLSDVLAKSSYDRSACAISS